MKKHPVSGPEMDDGFAEDHNAWELGAAVGAGSIAVASVGVTTAVAPTMTVIPGLIAGAFGLAGYNARHGHLPFMKGDVEVKVTATAKPKSQPKSDPAPAATDFDGKDVDIEGL